MDFELLSQADQFAVGRLAGETWSGVYLSSTFMDRLAEAHSAAQKRLDAAGDATIPDSVRNLVGLVTRLLGTYGAAVESERDAHHEAHRKEAWEALMRAKSIVDDMSRR